jgi:dTDP-4-dehydrorhamnose 3,5-epimerase
MLFIETKLKGAFVIELEKYSDDRGFFSRAWCQKEFKEQGINSRFVQANIGFSKNSGTIRGIHYQIAPFEEAKLVRCIRGAIFDVVLDLRPELPSFKQWFGVELSDENRKMLYVPEGCAHGYQTLVDNTEVFYQVSQVYSAESERGIRWNDPEFDIEWPIDEDLVISEKDQNWSDFME